MVDNSIVEGFNTNDADMMAKIIKESKESILKFTDYFFPHHKMDEDGNRFPAAVIHPDFDELLRGSVGFGRGQGYYNALAVMARGMAKSTLGNFAFSQWAALFAGKSYIIIMSATEKSVQGHFNALKDEIKTNKYLHFIGVEPMPSTEGGVDNSTSFTYYVPDQRQPSGRRVVQISAYTLSNFPRGLKKGAKRPDLFILDDFERAKKGNTPGVESRAYREEVQKVFESEIVFSGFSAKTMQIVFLGTIMHEGQLLWSVADASAKGEYFPTFRCVKYPIIENYGTPDAYSNWPEKMSVEEFEKRMFTARKRGTENIIYNELLCQPTAPENQIFSRDDFRYFLKKAGRITECDIDGKELVDGVVVKLSDVSIVISTDLAFTQNERSDYTAFAICACDNDENIFILDIVYGKWNTHVITQKADELVSKYNPVAFGVESNSGGAPIIEMLEKELRENKNFDGIIKLKATGLSKQDRITAKLQIPYKHGKVFHLFDSHYIMEYEYQVLSVARNTITSKHDDLVDAVSYTYDLVDEEIIYNSSDDNTYYDSEEEYDGNNYI